MVKQYTFKSQYMEYVMAESYDPVNRIEEIRQYFPTAKLKPCLPISHGYDHDIIIAGGHTYRFPKTSAYKALLKSELTLMNYLVSKVQVRIPNYDFIAPDNQFARHSYLKGNEFQLNQWQLLNPIQLEICIREIANLFSVIHGIAVVDQKKFGFYPNEAQKVLGNPPQLTCVHGDFDFNNLLWDNDEGLAVIDFGDRMIFDPAYDFTILGLIDIHLPNRVYELYTGPKDDSFLDRAGQYQDRYLKKQLNKD